MNAIIFSAFWGIIMMFTGAFLKKNEQVRILAILGALVLLLVNIGDLQGYHYFSFDTHNMLYFESFGLVFNCIAFASTLIFILLSGRDIQQVGHNVGEYYALIFFVL